MQKNVRVLSKRVAILLHPDPWHWVSVALHPFTCAGDEIASFCDTTARVNVGLAPSKRYEPIEGHPSGQRIESTRHNQFALALAELQSDAIRAVAGTPALKQGKRHENGL
jgi:hypothetical protein